MSDRPEDDLDDEFGDEPTSKAPSLKDVWRQQPALRLMVFVAPALLLGVAFFALQGGEPEREVTDSAVVSANPVVEAPGQAVSPVYQEALDRAEEQRRDVARQTGRSFVPTPRADTSQSFLENVEDPFALDPLAQWEEPAAPPPAPAPMLPDIEPIEAPAAPEVDQPPPPDYTWLIESMGGQMAALFGAWTPQPAQVYEVAPVEEPSGEANGEPSGGEQGPAPGAGSGEEGEAEAPTGPVGPAIVNAGEIDYAYMLTTANSDVPGPVLAQLVSGPFSGGRLIGSFAVADEQLVLSFETLVFDREEISIDAIAMDPDSTLTAVRSRVDRHYFERMVLPAAANFITAFANAFAERDTTVTVVEGGTVIEDTDTADFDQQLAEGVASSTEVITSTLLQQADRPVTIILEAGTPFGLLYLQAIREALE